MFYEAEFNQDLSEWNVTPCVEKQIAVRTRPSQVAQNLDMTEMFKLCENHTACRAREIRSHAQVRKGRDVQSALRRLQVAVFSRRFCRHKM